MKKYLSIANNSEIRNEIKKSVFIGNASSVSTKEDAEAFVDSIRAIHPEAKHCCFAYLIRNGGISKVSDDGEPQGTAGIPMLEIIKKNGIVDIVVTVTRYFGGILLGAGGLCRAYGSTCADAIKAGGVSEFAEYDLITVYSDYSDYPKIEYELKKSDAIYTPPIFTDKVQIDFRILCENTDKIITIIRDITSARALINVNKRIFAPL